MGVLSLGAIALLAGLSIVGAFLGAERAGEMFNSPPMAGFWCALTVSLAAGPVFFRRLRRPALLAVHAGCVCVLVGGMLGSPAGHVIVGRLTDRPRVRRGFVDIARYHASDEILDTAGAVVGHTPFRLYVEDFWTEYAAPADLAVAPHDPAAGEPRLIPWTLGADAPIPYTDASVRVLRYLPGASVVFEGEPRGELVIQPAGGAAVRAADDEGAQVTLSEPKLTVRIIRRYGNYRWVLRDGRQTAEDVPGPPYQPALLLLIETPDGGAEDRLLYARRPMRRPPAPGVRIWYDFPPPVAARPDPASHSPAMEIELIRGAARQRRWLLSEWMWRDEKVELRGAPGATSGATMWMTHELVPVRAHKTALAVIDDAGLRRRAVVAPGKPLHVGGYHLYTTDQPYGNEVYATVMIRSDAGLSAVYVGFALLAAGVFGLFWIHPAWAALRKRRRGPKKPADTGAGPAPAG